MTPISISYRLLRAYSGMKGKRLGLVGFLFFFAKGLLWLIAPAVLNFRP